MNLFRNRNKEFEDLIKNQIGDVEYKPSGSSWEKIASNLPEDGFESVIADKVNSFTTIPENTTWEQIETEITSGNFSNFKRFIWIPLLFIFFGSAAYFGYKNIERGNKQSVSSAENKSEKINSSVQETTKKPNESTVQITSPHLHSSEIIKPTLKHAQTQNNLVKHERFTSVESTPLNSKIKSTQTNTLSGSLTVKEKAERLEKNKGVTANIQNIKNTIAENVTVPTKSLEKNSAENNFSPDKKAEQPLNSVNTFTPVTDLTKVAPLPPSLSSPVLIDTINHTPKNIEIKHASDELTHFSISAITGIQYCYNQLSAPANSTINFNANISLRKKIEIPSVDWNGGFLLDYEISDHWRISGGLAIANFSQNFQYSVTTPAMNHQPVTDPGAQISHSNDSILTGNSIGNRIKYTWTEIPLFITYTFNPNSKIRFEIMTGMSYGIITGVDAALVSYDNVGVLLLTDKSNFPGIKNNLFVHFNPHLDYRLSKLVSVGVSPTFKYSITSITANDSWVEQRPYFIGISATLRRKF